MARHLRVEFSGAIYHVNCRMIGEGVQSGLTDGAAWPTERRLFRDDRDRNRFLDQLAERVEQYGIRLYLYVLMLNHFHLVFETPRGNCSAFMQALNTAYPVYYNLRHHRHGPLWDGRFKGKLVEGDRYLLALTRYVHLNPVRVGSIKQRPIEDRIEFLRDYPWSSYPGYIRKKRSVPFVEYAPMLSEMGGGAARGQRSRYRRFVESGLAANDEEFEQALKASPRSIGSDEFRERIDTLYEKLVGSYRRAEDASFRRTVEPVAAESVLSVVAEALGVEPDEFRCRRRNSMLRAVAARCLCRYSGLTQRDAAAALAIGSGAAVGYQLHKLAAQLPQDRALRRRLNQIEERLDAARGG